MKATLDSCPPRWATQPTDRPNRLAEVKMLADLLDYPLMPWQEFVLRVITEHEDGIPFYRDALVTVPRQCGKSEVVLGLMMLDRLLLWAKPRQQVLWNAQTLKDGVGVFSAKIWPRLDDSPLRKEFGLEFRRSLAKPEVEAQKTNSLVTIVGESGQAGHGQTLNLVLMDEAWAFQDNDREVALLPTMRTVKDPQWILASTAGDDTSLYLKEKVDAGRAKAEANHVGGSAYFEWSAPKSADWEDPKVWASCIPAWGHTVNESTLQYEKEATTEAAFRRNSLNQWVPSMLDPVIPWQFFDRATSRKGAPASPIVLGVDSNPVMDNVSVVACGRGVAEYLVEKSHTHWLADYLEQVVKGQADVRGVAAAVNSTAAPEVRLLEKRGVRVYWYDSRLVAEACQTLYDAFVRERVIVLNHRPSLHQALATVRRKELDGSRFKWARRTDEDPSIAPLMALTLGYHCSDELAKKPTGWGIISLDADTLADLDTGFDSNMEEEVAQWRAIYN